MAKGAEGTFVKVAVSENKQLLLELVGPKPDNLDVCEKCQYYVQTWITPKSERKLCYECFNESKAHIDQHSHWSTAKMKVKKGDSTHKLRYAKVYCPGCASQKTCTNIAKHVSDKHPELLENADDTIAPSQGDSKARSQTGPCKARKWGLPTSELSQSEQQMSADTSCDGEMMTDDESSDFVPQTLDEASLDSDLGTCQHCITALEKKDIAEHEKYCPEQVSECPWCRTGMAFKDYLLHIDNTCPKRRRRETVETTRTQPERAHKDNKTKAKMTGDVQELKEKIKELERRMDQLEPPLKRIIERLSGQQ